MKNINKTKMSKIEKLQEEYRELQIAIKFQEKHLNSLMDKADKKWSQIYDLSRDYDIKPKQR